MRRLDVGGSTCLAVVSLARMIKNSDRAVSYALGHNVTCSWRTCGSKIIIMLVVSCLPFRPLHRVAQTIARLIVPQRSPLRCQATEVLGHLLAMSSVDHEATRYPTTPGARERSDRSGRARRSTDRGLADDIIRAAGEDEDLESSVTESASSSSSLADAASFVYR